MRCATHEHPEKMGPDKRGDLRRVCSVSVMFLVAQAEYAMMTVPVDERDWDEAPADVGARLK